MAPAIDLDKLIRLVQERATDLTPLTLVSTAAAVSGDLAAVGDSVINHYVQEARAAGHSWAEIGEALGVTKQAVHYRFVTQAGSDVDSFVQNAMLQRFTDRARTAISAARDVAIGMGHSVLGTEHLLLGILEDPESLASKLLDKFGVTKDKARAAVEARVAPTAVTGADTPLMPGAKQALERSIAEALQLGHNYVGTEHLLLSLVNSKGIAATVLAEFGIKRTPLAKEVRSFLDAYMAEQAKKA